MNTIQIRKKGTFTLPSNFRQKYGVEEGEIYSYIDLGEGALLLKRKVSQVDILSRRAAQILKEDNVTLDEILETLDEEHRKVYNEKYGKK